MTEVTIVHSHFRINCICISIIPFVHRSATLFSYLSNGETPYIFVFGEITIFAG